MKAFLVEDVVIKDNFKSKSLVPQWIDHKGHYDSGKTYKHPIPKKLLQFIEQVKSVNHLNHY
jgi:hypothetical protein